MSETEPELGLGTITHSDNRYTDITFSTRKTSRKYSVAGAPLRRVVFKPGDAIHDKSGALLRVTSVHDDPATGLVTYSCGGVIVPESDLSDTVNTATPVQRLLNGTISSAEDFNLRHDLLGLRLKSSVPGARVRGRPDRTASAPVGHCRNNIVAENRPGLAGGRNWLGKTIEACLVLHRLMVAEG